VSGARFGVVVNPTAGHGRGTRRGNELFAALERRGHDLRDLTGETPEAALDQARQAVVDGLDALVVVGGDGVVHLGANVVAGTDLPLGIVAAGSGNDIARAADLPMHDVSAAVHALERGLETGGTPVDAVRTGPPGYEATRWYLAVMSAGFDAAVNARANELIWPRGTARYVRAVFDELARFRPYGFRITLDDEVWEQSGTLVAVANTSSYGGGMRIAPDARWDDGLLDVVIAGPLSRAGVLGLFPRIFPGTHVRHPACSVVRARRVLLEPSHAGPVPPAAYADGERIGPLPIQAEVVPGAVRLLT
jgi:diacylglycerol kinase (ATP)